MGAGVADAAGLRVMNVATGAKAVPDVQFPAGTIAFLQASPSAQIPIKAIRQKSCD
jgi:hypothetical protein